MLCLGPFEPSVGGAVELALDSVFGVGVHPAGADLVDADAVTHQRERKVAGHRLERTLRHAVAEDERLPTVAAGRADVDDRTGYSLAAHDLCCGLDHEQRGAGVDRHHLLEALGRRRPHVVTPRRGGDVDHAVDDAEPLIGCTDHGTRRAGITHVGLDEDGRRSEISELLGQRLALVGTASGDHHARRTIGDDLAGDGLAETLCATADDDDLAVEFSRHVPILCCCSPATIAAFAACTCGRSLISGTPTSQNAPPPVQVYASVCKAMTVVRSLCRAR